MIDITQPLGEGTAAWPGDRPFELDWTLRRDRGDSVDVAGIALSVHCGTHADGPRHVVGGTGAGELALEAFIGPAIVVDARGWIEGEPPVVTERVLAALPVNTPPRVLLRTREAVDPAVFPERFAALSPALCGRLAERGVVLVGTDAPSVDPADSKTLDAHRALMAAGIPNLENLVLTHVAPGEYTLVALPLRLVEADSSPVRAVLIGSTSVAGGERMAGSAERAGGTVGESS